MSSDVTRDEFQQLQVRVDVLDREVEGEKMVTRHILEQTRRNSDDLAAIKTRLDRVETRLDRVERSMDQRFDQLDKKVDGLTRSLPSIVSDVMREVLRERDER
jgi:tetrahydromethanopterin S-methyltransferase subunit G